MVGSRMNNRGDVVGQNTAPSQHRGLLYSNGTYFTLNDLVDNSDSIEFVPTSVNNGGEITGFAFSLSSIDEAKAAQITQWYRSARSDSHHYPPPPIPSNSFFGFLLVPQ
jgi:hypothetical protein